MGGRSAALTQNIPERVFSLVGLMICAADGPPLGTDGSSAYLKFVPETFLSLVDFKDERRTVRSWGADGPLANFKVIPETMFVLTRIKCTLTHWLIMADGLVFEQRTARDFAEKTVTASF